VQQVINLVVRALGQLGYNKFGSIGQRRNNVYSCSDTKIA